MRGAAKPNCHMLALSHSAGGRWSLLHARRCVSPLHSLQARDLGMLGFVFCLCCWSANFGCLLTNCAKFPGTTCTRFGKTCTKPAICLHARVITFEVEIPPILDVHDVVFTTPVASCCILGVRGVQVASCCIFLGDVNLDSERCKLKRIFL